ncbi:MAG: 1-(5-phosphoribosyl)-5-[(5-phosphoribosylamino)methylideneamino]imidazole-4-carboxamide isomerase [Pseudomonadota bacterium]
MQIIPAIDIRDGRCVRLLHGEYDKETRYDVDPVTLATHYSNLGLSTLHLVDLDGARDGNPVNTALFKRIADATRASIQVGGGIRSAAQINELFEVGVSRVVVGSLAVESPQTVAAWLQEFGGHRIVLALDVRIDAQGTPFVCTRAWTHTTSHTLYDTIERYINAGLSTVLCTDIAKDGALTGPSVALYESLKVRYPAMTIQASGGVANIDDLRSLRNSGVDGAITGKALLESHITDEEIRTFLLDA